MNEHQIYVCFSEARNYADRAAFISDLTLSSMWGGSEEADVPPERIKELGRIWDVAHITIKEIRTHTGLTQAALSEKFLIPKRTLEDWEGGRRECAIYVRYMLAQLCGMV